ncbi:type IV secretion system protein [Burkholderia pyrrocinia]|uniref:type IV secretion system protein n=1 Tax=Burkholderia pyrrocinia TaxID=60550 RepID=UPI001BCF6FBF|nr:type IV secretion system protein [Burkholderia pyrrocinia]QVN18978.1 type IV secretion system protein [Burkholderia pyrrocinia]
MATTTGVFSMIGTGIESGIGAYVTSTSAALSSALVPVVTTAVTLWIMAYGFAVMRGDASESIPTFSWRAAKIAMFLAVALGSGIYQSTVLNDVQTGTAALAQTISQAGGGMCATSANVSGSSASSVYTALDCYDAAIGAIASQDITRATQAGATQFGAALGYLMSAVIVSIGGGVFLVVCSFETVLARVFLDLVLGLGPIFIACAAFEPSRRYFDAWVGKVVTYCLLQVLIAAFLGMALSVFSSEVQSLTGLSSAPAADNGGNAFASFSNLVFGSSGSATTTDDQYFVSALGMLATGIFLAMLCWQLPSIASALGGGSAVSGIGAFAAGVGSRGLPGAVGKIAGGIGGLGQNLGGKLPWNRGGGGGSVSSGGGGGGAGLRPAYQRIVMDNLNRPGADS